MKFLGSILILTLRAYQWGISPLKNIIFGVHGCCRFTPSCSQYAIDAVAEHGPFTGAWLALRRVGRCHPWGGCGHDPVPHTKAG